jgi:hypothetical protein
VTSLTSSLNARWLERVLPWVGAVVLAAGVATFLVVYFGRGDSSTAPAANEQVPVVQRERIPVPADARRVAADFLATALARKQLARSYDLATPTLRGGLSKKEWVTGNITVPYYPVTRTTLKDARFSTDYSYARDIQLEVLLSPPKGIKQRPGNFVMGLVKRQGEWKVDYIGPRDTIPVPTNVP